MIEIHSGSQTYESFPLCEILVSPYDGMMSSHLHTYDLAFELTKCVHWFRSWRLFTLPFAIIASGVEVLTIMYHILKIVLETIIIIPYPICILDIQLLWLLLFYNSKIFLVVHSNKIFCNFLQNILKCVVMIRNSNWNIKFNLSHFSIALISSYKNYIFISLNKNFVLKPDHPRDNLKINWDNP